MRIVLILCGLAVAAQGASAPSFEDRVDARAFAKIQLHVHTSESDGDSAPDAVAAWYAAHGFSALAITDHDKLTSASAPGLALIAGVEITSRGGKKPVHVNALCGSTALKGGQFKTPRAALADATAKAKADGALALVNHPDWTGALDADDLAAVTDFDMLEIASGHPAVGDDGDKDRPSAEALWQSLLDQGRRVFAVGVDDAHDFARAGEDRKPGRAWVEAWDAGAAAACDALRAGRFYASTGVRLKELTVSGGTITVDAAEFPSGSVVEFLGANAKLLAKATAVPAAYALKGGERFVRARVRLSDGRRAWTQAYFTASN
jgi:hypothetical protein